MYFDDDFEQHIHELREEYYARQMEHCCECGSEDVCTTATMRATAVKKGKFGGQMKRNDRHDTDSHEALLIRAGHHVWAWYRAEKPQDGGYPTESGPLWEALQTIWQAKKAYRVELAAKRALRAETVRQRFSEVEK